MENRFKTYKINIKGIVQGVGFRPFIWRISTESNLKGIAYIIVIKKQKPSPAVIESIEYSEIDFNDFQDFKISSSETSEKQFQLISPDLATCKECVDDIDNPDERRRFSYAFTNCTNCGPRFTIIKKMPYEN